MKGSSELICAGPLTPDRRNLQVALEHLRPRSKTDRRLARWHRLNSRRSIWGNSRFSLTASRIGRNDHHRLRYRTAGLSTEANRAARLRKNGCSQDYGQLADMHGKYSFGSSLRRPPHAAATSMKMEDA